MDTPRGVLEAAELEATFSLINEYAQKTCPVALNIYSEGAAYCAVLILDGREFSSSGMRTKAAARNAVAFDAVQSLMLAGHWFFGHLKHTYYISVLNNFTMKLCLSLPQYKDSSTGLGGFTSTVTVDEKTFKSEFPQPKVKDARGSAAFVALGYFRNQFIYTSLENEQALTQPLSDKMYDNLDTSTFQTENPTYNSAELSCSLNLINENTLLQCISEAQTEAAYAMLNEFAQRTKRSILLTYPASDLGFSAMIKLDGITFTSSGHSSKIKAKGEVSTRALKSLMDNSPQCFDHIHSHWISILNNVAMKLKAAIPVFESKRLPNGLWVGSVSAFGKRFNSEIGFQRIKDSQGNASRIAINGVKDMISKKKDGTTLAPRASCSISIEDSPSKNAVGCDDMSKKSNSEADSQTSSTSSPNQSKFYTGLLTALVLQNLALGKAKYYFKKCSNGTVDVQLLVGPRSFKFMGAMTEDEAMERVAELAYNDLKSED